VGEETASDPAARAATARANAGARAKLLGWARQSIDLIPTPWLITGAGAVALGATAAFGGLATAPVEPIPELSVGESFRGSDFDMTVLGVELRDDDDGTLVFLDEEKGERVLVVTLDVTNTFPTPRSSASGSDRRIAIDGIRVEGVEGAPVLTRADDGTGYPMLQPDVPARLLAAWVVGPDDLHDGDEVVLSLPDSTHYVGKSLTKGDYWWDEHVGATLTATIDEVTTP
jgi:hypothetical protein